jgi:hypothetical protein
MFIANFKFRSMVRSLMAMAYEVVTYPSFHPYFTLKKRALAETADYISALIA